MKKVIFNLTTFFVLFNMSYTVYSTPFADDPVCTPAGDQGIKCDTKNTPNNSSKTKPKATNTANNQKPATVCKPEGLFGISCKTVSTDELEQD